MKTKKPIIAVVGLGYVGLPLAVAFAKAGFDVIGFDINARRIAELRDGKDHTGEVAAERLKQRTLIYTTDPTKLKSADFIIVAVPTPVFENKKPDLGPLDGASKIIGENLKRDAVIVYESTVWPGLTEEYCAPLIEKFSGRVCGKDFFIGYSPERINPGDKEHSLEKMIKVVSGMDTKTLKKVSWLYDAICKAGTFEAASIRDAEAAKVIENTQRDLNIALMNELAMIFKRLGISTRDVLKTASTKWNFGRYSPGMVGGHCIPVDPYYLTTLAQKVGYKPRVILAGRAINDAMPKYVASLLEEGLREVEHAQSTNMHKAQTNSKSQKTKKLKAKSYKPHILVLGLTFKENVPDTRNSPAKYLIRLLKQQGYRVDAHDPRVFPAAFVHEKFGGTFLKKIPAKAAYDGIIITVAHREFVDMSVADMKKLLRDEQGVLVDVRGVFADTRLPKDIIYRTL